MDQQMQQAMQATQQFMQQHKLSAEVMSAVGKMARKAISDAKFYQILKNYLIKNQILTEQELSDKPNYMVLTALATMGALAGEM